ncbi:Piwi-like protein Siwi [Gryllus bimaculatus]|nr:Piwi-like protein Siwi [Gryllus bimaculatus]
MLALPLAVTDSVFFVPVRVGVREDSYACICVMAASREVRPAAFEGLMAGGGNGDAPQRVRGRARAQMLVQRLHTRPEHIVSKKGYSGSQITLQANYFKLDMPKDWELLQYRVDFNPEQDLTSIRKYLLRTLRPELGAFLFDGTVLFTTNRLTNDVKEVREMMTQRQDGENVRVSLRLVGMMAAGDYQYLQFFNILLRQCMRHLHLQLVGRNFYDAKAKIVVPEFHMELWPGYITSIRQHESSILLCADTSLKLMRKDTALSLLEDFHSKDLRNYKHLFSAAVIGAVVLTDYNNRTYRVHDVAYDMSPEHTFDMKSGEKVSFKDYYRKRYNLNIICGTQPMLITRPAARERRAGAADIICLVPELCRLTGLTEAMRQDFKLMRTLATYSRASPDARMKQIVNYAKRLNSEPEVQKELDKWGLGLKPELVTLNGRILSYEKIVQENGKYEPSQLVDWTRDMRSRTLLVVPRLNCWAIIFQAKARRDVEPFIKSLITASRGMGWNLPEPELVGLPDDRSGTYVQSIETSIQKVNPDLLMLIVPNNNSARYSSIKKKCCLDRGVPSQVVVNRSVTGKGVMSVATKIAVQICCKLGGAPWSVEIPLTGLMVVGFDVSPDTAKKGQNFGALVASVDPACTRYFSTVNACASGEELSNHLAISMIKALHKYREHNNGQLPNRIVIYRDGVGEGMLPYVWEIEVQGVRRRLEEIFNKSGTALHMAFIVVTKRINTRLFMKGDNPAPGTIVDDVVTLPERYDFFLVSQSVRQGTVGPTSYHVLYDNLGLDPDKLQRLTYKMTHLYYNWSGTVRVPAACQYAHKLAVLTAQAVHQPSHKHLEDVLFFL